MTFTERVAAHFRAHPNRWIDGDDFRPIGGKYAYRSRISDCRTELGMTIENRQRVLHGANGKYTISEYRFVPKDEQVSA